MQLAASLNNLDNRLSERGDAASRAEALDCAGEAVGLYAWCYAQMPAAFERKLWIAARPLTRVAEAAWEDGEVELAKARAMLGAPTA